MTTQTVYRALSTHLNTLNFTPTPQFAWGNEKLTPVKGTPWLRQTLLSDGSTSLSTCPVQTRVNKIYQVDCFADQSDGADEAFRLADAVSALFFPDDGTTNFLTSGSLTIQINQKPEISPLYAQGGFVGAAVLIRCFALI